MSTYDTITFEHNDRIALVTINRPDSLNALNKEVMAEVAHVFGEIDRNKDIAVSVLTGEGRVFSAGADLDGVRAGLATEPVWEVVSARLAALPCPTVAALNGTLAGGAFGIALACDFRVAVPGASFFYPVMKLGYLPQPSDPARLAALIGPARARRLLLAGARIDAATALDWGLVDALADPDGLTEAACELLAAGLSAGPAHAGAIKALLPRA